MVEGEEKIREKIFIDFVFLDLNYIKLFIYSIYGYY